MISATDRIERSVLITAPVERVWTLLTTAEHLRRGVGGASAAIDLRPGGRLTLSWEEHGTVHGRVTVVDAPTRFAYRWLHDRDQDAEPTEANSTLVEFTLASEGGSCRVSVAESGFDALERSDRA